MLLIRWSARVLIGRVVSVVTNMWCSTCVPAFITRDTANFARKCDVRIGSRDPNVYRPPEAVNALNRWETPRAAWAGRNQLTTNFLQEVSLVLRSFPCCTQKIPPVFLDLQKSTRVCFRGAMACLMESTNLSPKGCLSGVDLSIFSGLVFILEQQPSKESAELRVGNVSTSSWKQHFWLKEQTHFAHNTKRGAWLWYVYWCRLSPSWWDSTIFRPDASVTQETETTPDAAFQTELRLFYLLTFLVMCTWDELDLTWNDKNGRHISAMQSQNQNSPYSLQEFACAQIRWNKTIWSHLFVSSFRSVTNSNGETLFSEIHLVSTYISVSQHLSRGPCRREVSFSRHCHTVSKATSITRAANGYCEQGSSPATDSTIDDFDKHFQGHILPPTYMHVVPCVCFRYQCVLSVKN